MMRLSLCRLVLCVCVGAPAALLAQAAQPTDIPAARPLGATLTTSTVLFRSITSVRTLSGSRLLVNDGSGHRVVILDSALASPVTVMDSVAGKENSYGTAATGVLPHLADSSLFVDRTAKVFAVIDPSGKIARTMSLPGSQSSYLYLSSTLYGTPGMSRIGFIYESPMLGGFQPRPSPGMPDIVTVRGDTSAIVSFDFVTRRIDTLARFGNGRGTPERITSTGLSMERPPIRASQYRFADTWTITTDGSVAIVRGRDFRIDWIGAGGAITAGPRIAHEWIRNTDDDKVRIVDSLNRLTQRTDSSLLASFLADSTAVANGTGTPAQVTRMRVTPLDISSLLGDIDPSIIANMTLPSRSTVRQRPQAMGLLQIKDIPDYMPVVETLSGSVRADGDNNVWIRVKPPVRSTQGVLWDVVNRQGVLIDRVYVPTSKTIVGFAPGGIVYLSSRAAGLTLTVTSPLGIVAGPPTLQIERVQWGKR